MNPESIHQESFIVRRLDCDPRLQIRPACLFSYLQECGFGHSRSVGLDTDELIGKGYAWFLIQVRLTVDRYPSAYERITVRTWPSTLSGIRAIREFEIIDEHGQVCVSATARWLLIGLERGRPVRIPSFIEDAFSPDPTRAIDYAFPRLSVLESIHHSREIHVRFSDLDLNNHVNSAVYFDWLIEGVKNELVDQCEPFDFELIYRQETNQGDTIQSGIGPAIETREDVQFEHSIMRNDTVIATGTSSWRPRPMES